MYYNLFVKKFTTNKLLQFDIYKLNNDKKSRF